jgi:hypothetical protein
MEGLKMNEQCGNVHENKGPLWKTGAEAGMSMKKNDLPHQDGNVTEKKGS